MEDGKEQPDKETCWPACLPGWTRPISEGKREARSRLRIKQGKTWGPENHMPMSINPSLPGQAVKNEQAWGDWPKEAKGKKGKGRVFEEARDWECLGERGTGIFTTNSLWVWQARAERC